MNYEGGIALKAGLSTIAGSQSDLNNDTGFAPTILGVFGLDAIIVAEVSGGRIRVDDLGPIDASEAGTGGDGGEELV